MKLEEIEAALNLKENRERKEVLMTVNKLVKALKHGGRVQGRLHKISFSGGYGFQEIQFELGHLFLDDSFPPEKRMPNYRKKYLTWVGGVLFVIFLEPISPFLPHCYIEFVTPESMGPSELKAFPSGSG